MAGREGALRVQPEGSGAEPWLPQPEEWTAYTAEAQSGLGDSMLELYRAALTIRREHPALGEGTMSWTDTADGVLGFRREPGFTCLVNLSRRASCPRTTASC